MKAAVFYGKGEPLKIEDIDTPTYKEEEVLVKISACGLCRTDLHYLHGVPTFKKPPIILGHEISGIVEEIGNNVKKYKKGDKILIPPVLACGHCIYCRSGNGTLCANQIMLGNHRDGGFAEYIAINENFVFSLPAEIPLQEGCIISDAISTPYHAIVNRANLKPGEKIAIFGCGGVGLAAVQVANLVGGEIFAIDIYNEKLALAKKFGALYTINAKEEPDVAKKIRKLSDGGVDVAVEVIGNPTTIQNAFESVRRGGKVVIVGYTDENISINAGRLMFREIELIGSLGCGLQEYPKIINIVREGRIKIKELVSHKFSLENINEGFEKLEKSIPELVRGIVVFSDT